MNTAFGTGGRTACASLVATGMLVLTFSVSTTPAAAQDSFARFITSLRDVCAQDPASACTQRVSNFLDNNQDNQISLQEFEVVRAQATSTVKSPNSGLSKVERSLISMGALTLQNANLAATFANFDSNADGGLSESELFADFKLDHRPLGKIIADPDGVDWARLAGRFGKFGTLFLGLLPPSHRNGH